MLAHPELATNTVDEDQKALSEHQAQERHYLEVAM